MPLRGTLVSMLATATLTLPVLFGCGDSAPNPGWQCSAATCPNGCCLNDMCQMGNTNQSCGEGGTACQQCFGAQTCSAGLCVEACNYLSCSQGCCGQSGQCVTFPDESQCGTQGGPCQTCPPQTKCILGQCVPDQQQGCDSSCPGCCFQGSCVPGNTKTACGKGGTACVPCVDPNVCDPQDATCKPPPETCDVTTCKEGCCTSEGKCVPFTQQPGLKVCGKGGEACHVCPSQSPTCVQGTCVGSQTSCASYCTKGCCDAQDQCISYDKQDVLRCGTQGDLCSPCVGTPSCVDGQCVGGGAWEIWVLSAQIATKTPDGDDWDNSWFFNPKPDVYAGIAPSSMKWLWEFYWTKTLDDTFSPYWNEKIAVWKEEDLLDPSGVYIAVYDDDYGPGNLNQRIGLCAGVLTLAQLQAGTFVIPTCGSASNLTFKFVRQQ